MAIVVFASIAVLAGEPQCPPALSECHKAAGMDFFEGFSVNPNSLTTAQTDAVCKLANWRTKEGCDSACPLQLRITSPPELASIMCVTDNIFTPYQPAAHIDLHHPLAGKDLELIAPGTPGSVERHGCSPDNYLTKNYTNKIAIIRRGTCYFYTKFQEAAAAGAAAGVMVNHQSNALNINMVGSSLGFDHTPAVFAPRHYGDLLFDALDAGMKVVGQLKLTCEAKQIPEDEYVTDGCPDPMLIQPVRANDGAKACEVEEEEKNRLCVRCPVEATYTVLNTTETVCLYGALLTPRAKANYIQYNTAFLNGEQGYVLGAGDVVLAPESRACHGDFDGLEGKVVFVNFPTECIPFESARLAQAAGVAALIFLSPMTSSSTQFLQGLSNFLSIPVHSLTIEDSRKVLRGYRTLRSDHSVYSVQGRFLGVELSEMSLMLGEMPEAQNRTKEVVPEQHATTLVAETTGASLEMNVVTVVCFVFAGIFVILITAVVVRLWQSSRRLTKVMHTKKRKIPLAVASITLSLSVTLVVCFIAFFLVHSGGKDATNDARSHGERSVEDAYGYTERYIKFLSTDLRKDTILRVTERIENLLNSGEKTVSDIAAMYSTTNNTWASFNSKFPSLVEHVKGAFAVSVITPSGYYAYWDTGTFQEGFKNDERIPTNGPPISVTNDPSLYEFATWDYNEDKREAQFWAAYDRGSWDPMEFLGGQKGDPFTFTRNEVSGQKTWHVTTSEDYQVLDWARKPISCFTPVRNKAGEFIGSAESRMQYGSIRAAVDQVVSGGMEELTLLVFDAATDTILGTNVLPPDTFPHQIQEVSVEVLRGSYLLYDAIPVQIRAFARYLHGSSFDRSAASGDTTFSGQFNQKQFYVHQNQYLAKLSAERYEGTAHHVVDASGNAYDAEMRGPCRGNESCMGTSDSGRVVLRFGGEDVLHVYQNLTQYIPRVAATQDRSHDVWASHNHLFNKTYPLGASSNPKAPEACIRYDSINQGVPTCMLREAFYLTSFSVAVTFMSSVDITEELTDATPRLFSTTYTGDDVVRLFGNGQLFLGILSYGCRTKALPGGLPKDKWTTIVASINYEKRRCEVYVNGKFISSGAIETSFEIGRVLSNNAHFVGRGLHGEMSEFSILNTSMSVIEAQQHYANGVFKRDVEEKEWWADINYIERDSHAQVRGVRWGVAALIPREAIMRSIDTNNKAVQQNLKIEAANTSRKLDRIVNESLVIVVTLILCSVLVFLCFNKVLTEPFAEVASAMNHAAMFQIDTIPEHSSRISELDTMFTATTQLLANLESYRPFLPDALFQNIQWAGKGSSGGELCNAAAVPGERSGFVCVVFTDIQGSTMLWERHPQQMKTWLKTHNDVVRACINRNGGYEVKTIGDSYMAAFEECKNAVEFGLDVQLSLQREDWGDGAIHEEAVCRKEAGKWHGLRVRIGINFGEAEVDFNEVTGRYDYHGPTVNKAARIEASGAAGGVTISQEVLDELVALHKSKPAPADAAESAPSPTVPLASPNASNPLDASVRSATLKTEYHLGLSTPSSVLGMGKIPLKGISEQCYISVLLPTELQGRTDTLRVQMREKKEKARAGNVETGNIVIDVASEQRSSRESCATKSSRGADRLGRARKMPAGRFDLRKLVSVAKTAASLDLSLSPDTHDTTMSTVNEALSKVVSCVERSEGTIISLLSCTVYSGWGTSKACTTPLEASHRYLRILQLSVGGMRKFSIGIAAGRAHFGNVGSLSQKFITVLSPAVGLAGRLCSAAAEVGVYCLHAALPSVLGGEGFATCSALSRHCRPVDRWQPLNFPSECLIVYEVKTDVDITGNTMGADGEAPAVTEEEDREAWGWSAAYTQAFLGNDHEQIAEHGNASSEPLSAVVTHLREGTHLRAPFAL